MFLGLNRHLVPGSGTVVKSRREVESSSLKEERNGAADDDAAFLATTTSVAGFAFCRWIDTKIQPGRSSNTEHVCYYFFT